MARDIKPVGVSQPLDNRIRVNDTICTLQEGQSAHDLLDPANRDPYIGDNTKTDPFSAPKSYHPNYQVLNL